MASVEVKEQLLTVRLTLLERLMALRGNVSVPLSAIESVQVIDRPLNKKPAAQARLGFAGGGAPLRGVASVRPRARCEDGRALIVVWRNSRSLVVELNDQAGEWRLLAVSCADADAVARQLKR